MDVKYKFLRKLKEAGIIRVIWTSTHDNEADIFTKNLPGPAFEKHIKNFVGEDEYMITGT